MALRNSLLILMVTISACGGKDVHLVPESPLAYEQCDKMCKEKYGESVSVYSVQKGVTPEDFVCYCR
jgi:hypothetical protein